MTFEDALKRLNPQQREAVEYVNGYLLVNAGAGSGKTSMLVARTANMVQNYGIAPSSILLVTFTNRAANEMKQRITQLIPDAGHITACTIHSFCAMQLRIWGGMFGLGDFTIITPSDAQTAIKMIKSSTGNEFTSRSFPTNKLVVSLISAVANREMSLVDVIANIDGFEKCIGYEAQLELLKTKYEEYKKDRNVIDYDDILLTYLKILESEPRIVEKVADAYRYIMVDEYQDTNTVQEKILLKIAGKHGNLMAVGDYGQSLYGFRGANVMNIVNFPSKVPNCHIVNMMTNYRSNNEILDVANGIIGKSTETTPLPMNGTHQAGWKPEVYRTFGQTEEMEYVLDGIIFPLVARGVSLDNIAVLYRSSRSVNKLESLIAQRDVPYQKFGGLKFFDREHIQDIFAYIRVVVNSKDELAWFRILQSIEGVSTGFGKVISQCCLEKGARGLIENPYVKRKFYRELLALYKAFTGLTGTPEEIMKAIAVFYHDLKEKDIKGMKTDAVTKAEALAKLESNMQDISILVEGSKTFNQIDKFLDSFSLDNDSKDNETVIGNLTLSTIHSAKGLEWDVVIVLDCVDSVFPNTNISDEGSSKDNEELRCMYVAVTRAKERLVMMVPETVTDYSGGRTMVDMSHFLKGIEQTYTVMNIR